MDEQAKARALIAPDWTLDADHLPRYPADWNAFARANKVSLVDPLLGSDVAAFLDWIENWCCEQFERFGIDRARCVDELHRLSGAPPCGINYTVSPTDKRMRGTEHVYHVPAPAWLAVYLWGYLWCYRRAEPGPRRELALMQIGIALAQIPERGHRDTLKRNLPRNDAAPDIVEYARNLLRSGVGPRELSATVARHRRERGLSPCSTVHIRRILKASKII